jgi:hypothetical protein
LIGVPGKRRSNCDDQGDQQRQERAEHTHDDRGDLLHCALVTVVARPNGTSAWVTVRGAVLLLMDVAFHDREAPGFAEKRHLEMP